MTTFAAAILKPSVAASNSDIAVANPNTMSPSDAGTTALVLVAASFADNVGPVPILSANYNATRLKSFYDEWYNRIHIYPTSENFGTIVKSTTYPIGIWNASTTVVSLDAVSDLSAYGIEYDNLTLPMQMQPLDSAFVYMKVGVNGPAQINATAQFSFSGIVDTLELPVTGQRSRLFDFLPEWSQGVQIQLEYLTDVLTARDGTEQRRGVRQTARRSYSFTVGATGARKRQMRDLMLTWKPYAMSFPDPVNFGRIVSRTGAGAQTLTLQEVPYWMVSGVPVIVTDGSNFVMSSVQSVNTDTQTVTLASILVDAWGPNSTVHLVLTGRIAGDAQASHQTDSTSQFKIKFVVDPASFPYPTLLPATDTFASRELFNFKITWSEDVGDTIIWPRDSVDYGFGVVNYFVPVVAPVLVQKVTVACVGVDQIRAVSDFFCRQYGMLREFAFPTHIADMVLASPISAGAASIEILGTAISDYYDDNAVFGNIQMVMRNGTVYNFAVAGVLQNAAENTIVQLASNVGPDIAISDVNFISWLNVSRFASDSITLNYKTSSFASVECAVQTLPNNAAEVLS